MVWIYLAIVNALNMILAVFKAGLVVMKNPLNNTNGITFSRSF